MKWPVCFLGVLTACTMELGGGAVPGSGADASETFLDDAHPGQTTDGGGVSFAKGPPAYCQANVLGTLIDTETDYVPNVVHCENGLATFEALKVQAIAARSFMYYKMDSTGILDDSQGDQVYSCGSPATADHIRAAKETEGLILQYKQHNIAAFFVAGAIQDLPTCTGGANDPTTTEYWVTYNQGKSGDAITQTELGWVDPSNVYNRGCLSQNGSHCLAEAGMKFDEILRYYYGDDIELVKAVGPCIQ